MSITVTIAAPILQEITGGTDVVEVNGVATFREILGKLDIKFPGLKDEMYDEKGELNSIIDVYVNGESVYPNELSAPVKDGDVVSITMLYEGG